MDKSNRFERKPRVIWVYSGRLSEALDSTTWIETSRELGKNRIDVTLFFEGPAEPEQFHGVKTKSFRQSKTYFIGSMVFHLHLTRYLIKEWQDVDIILFHQLSAPWLMPLRLLPRKRRGGRPLLVMDTRDLNVREKGLRNRLRVKYFDLAHSLANKWADGQLAITQKMASLVDIPDQQLWGLWPSGVNLGRFREAMKDRSWPKGEDEIHLTYLGKLHAERNLISLCHAIQSANELGMNFRLSLVGSGPGQAELRAFIAKSNSPISVLPPIPHHNIPALLKQTHVGVTSLPDPMDEKYAASSPIKLFEYMAAGLPILATKNPCHGEVLGQSWFAFWAEDAGEDAILLALRQIWQKRDSLRSLGMLSARAARNWTWEESGRKLATALKAGLYAISDHGHGTLHPKTAQD